MPDLNLNYGYVSDALPVGTVPDSRLTHTSSCDSAIEAIQPGHPVSWTGTIPAASGTAVRGVARWSTTMVQTDAGLVSYAVGDTIPLVSWGPVLVNIVGAVTAGQILFAIISGADKGKYTATSGATTTTKGVGTCETTLAASGVGILFVQYPTA